MSLNQSELLSCVRIVPSRHSTCADVSIVFNDERKVWVATFHLKDSSKEQIVMDFLEDIEETFIEVWRTLELSFSKND